MYTKQSWANGPEGNTPVSAERLGHIEDGVAAAHDAADAAQTAAVAAGDAAAAASSGLASKANISALAAKADVSALDNKSDVGHTHTPAGIGAATAVHAHTAVDINDATATGRSVLTAATGAAARTAVGAAAASHTHPVADLIATGTRDASTFLRGDGTFAAPPGTTPTLANIPAGSTLTVLKSGGVWPARPTSRADVTVAWKGPDPSPPVVASGTGGQIDGVDYRLVTP